MSKRITIEKIEFYITNVCNLTCSGCNRYNNYKFAGWENWDDYADIYAQWAEKIDIIAPVILGGEPLLNPTINSWVSGIKKLWPDHRSVQIQSNGTRIDMVDGLHATLRAAGSWVGISLHSLDDREAIFKRIRNFLVHPIVETQDPNHPSGAAYQFLDAKGVNVHVWISDHFTQSNIIQNPAGEFTLYNSDPIRAHKNCSFAQWKNYHFIGGKIYKCGPAALMPMFDDQYKFNISDQDRALINSYRPLTIDEFDERGEEFFRTIDDPIPQCKFCPESYQYKPITFTNLKPNKI